MAATFYRVDWSYSDRQRDTSVYDFREVKSKREAVKVYNAIEKALPYMATPGFATAEVYLVACSSMDDGSGRIYSEVLYCHKTETDT